MAAVQFDALREAVRELCSLPTFSTSSPVKLATVNTWINQALRSYYGLLLEQKSDEYVTFEELITVNAAAFNTATLTGARFRDIRRAFWERGSDDVVEIVRNQDGLYQRSEAPVSWGHGVRPTYALVRGLIYWLPVPSGTYSVRLWYVGLPADLVNPSDTVDAGAGWEEFVHGYVCGLIARAQEEDPSRFDQMRAEGEARIRAQKPRDRSSARQVRDARGVRPESRYRRDRRFPWLP